VVSSFGTLICGSFQALDLKQFILSVDRPIALLTLCILPFMAFGAEAEMKMHVGEDEVDAHADDDQETSGGIVVESLLNMRTVASLSLEDVRKKKFVDALHHEDPTPMRSNAIKGSTSGLGQFVQMWGIALMFWWGGWLLQNYPNQYSFRDFLISMFSLMFSLTGMGIAMQVSSFLDREHSSRKSSRLNMLSYYSGCDRP
jgi:ATP-binding cassette subfamily B (MDR/TAP) protein 1